MSFYSRVYGILVSPKFANIIFMSHDCFQLYDGGHSHDCFQLYDGGHFGASLFSFRAGGGSAMARIGSPPSASSDRDHVLWCAAAFPSAFASRDRMWFYR